MATNNNRGKFHERLKKIAFLRRNKNNEPQIEDNSNIYINFLKVVAAIPGLVYDSVINSEDKIINIQDLPNKKNLDDLNNNDASLSKKYRINKSGLSKSLKNNAINVQEVINKSNYNDNVGLSLSTNKTNDDRVAKRKIINDISINEIKTKQDKFYKNRYIGLDAQDDKKVLKNDTLDNAKVKQLEKSIINLIKKDLIKVVNELEILQSELYILSEVNGDNKTLRDCQIELDHVKNMLCKIDKLKEKYDFLKDNYDFEYLLEINNNDLVDKIIELKDTFGKNELKAVSEDYKLLEVYKYLYLKIDDLQDKTVVFEEKKKQEEAKLKERDINFEELKQSVYNVDSINRNYENFISNQNDLLRRIDSNVSKIDSYEQVDYHLKGFSELFKNTFKYFGLLMMNPLKGIIPSIATETLITGNLIKNLYKTLEWEETRKIVYEAIDYSGMINNAISDLESTSSIVDATLDDIVHLKMKYNEQFKKYQGDFLEYREIMHKINDMENKIIGNKIKIEMMKKKALEQKEVNDKKLRLVKEMNEKK